MDDIYTKKPEECAYSFTQHTACEFFPCHKTAHPEDFNCLFCYCPLYTLGSKGGGNFTATSSPRTRNSWSWPRKTAENAKKRPPRGLFFHHYFSSSVWSPLLHI